MKEYIERSYAEYLVDHFGGMLTWSKEDILSEIKRNLDRGKIADVVKVVRCGECIHHSKAITPGRVICDKHAIPRNDTDFCSDGRRDKPEN